MKLCDNNKKKQGKIAWKNPLKKITNMTTKQIKVI